MMKASTGERSWTLAQRKVILETPWAVAENNSYVTTDGRRVDDHLVVRRSPFVLVIAERQDKVLLVEQYRPATNKSYISLPAGYLEKTETPLQAAARELREETGHEAVDLRHLGSFDPLPGFVDSPAYVVRCKALPCKEARTDSAEEISRVLSLSWAQILEGISSGSIHEMQAVAALLLASSFQQRRLTVKARSPEVIGDGGFPRALLHYPLEILSKVTHILAVHPGDARARIDAVRSEFALLRPLRLPEDCAAQRDRIFAELAKRDLNKSWMRKATASRIASQMIRLEYSLRCTFEQKS